MSDPTVDPSAVDLSAIDPSAAPAAATALEAEPPLEPAPSYVKLAMRNMVRKGGKSLTHFALTTAGLIGLFVGLAYLTR
jgi:Protein of unknown function (DUF3285)